MAEPTLDDLLSVPTQQEVLDGEVIPKLVENKVRITDWARTAVYRAMANIVAFLRVDLRKVIGAIAAGGFEDYAFGFVEAPNGIDVTSWAPLVAKQRYGEDPIEASHTKRRFLLANSVATPYGPISAGNLTVLFPSGYRYILDEESDGITIPVSSSIEAIFRSEFPVDSTEGLNYDDASDEAGIILVTSQFPGVTVTNPAPDYTDVVQYGSGVGTVTAGGTPTGEHAVQVRITATGNEGDSSVGWETKVDAGAWTPHTGATATNLGGYGIDVTLDDNGGDPAFVEGTTFYFQTPGSDITEVGRDAETPPELGARCRALIPLLAAPVAANGVSIPISPTGDGYIALVKKASEQVKVAFVDTDPVINNRVLIYVAGQGAVLSGATIADIQAYLDQLNMISDRPVVLSPNTRTITMAGVTVVVRRGQKAAVARAMRERLRSYYRGVDQVTPLSINGRIDRAYVTSLIRNTPGVKRFPTDESYTINGANDDLQLPVTADTYELAVWTQDPATAFTFQEE